MAEQQLEKTFTAANVVTTHWSKVRNWTSFRAKDDGKTQTEGDKTQVWEYTNRRKNELRVGERSLSEENTYNSVQFIAFVKIMKQKKEKDVAKASQGREVQHT